MNIDTNREHKAVNLSQRTPYLFWQRITFPFSKYSACRIKSILPEFTAISELSYIGLCYWGKTEVAGWFYWRANQPIKFSQRIRHWANDLSSLEGSCQVLFHRYVKLPQIDRNISTQLFKPTISVSGNGTVLEWNTNKHGNKW